MSVIVRGDLLPSIGQIILGFGAFVNEHFDKLLISSLLIYFGITGSMDITRELLGALLLLIKSGATQIFSGNNNSVKDNANGLPKQEDVK